VWGFALNGETFEIPAEALVLALNEQEEQARAIVARWSQKDRVPGRLKITGYTFPPVRR
jgi:hypothetical protein